MAQSDAAAEFTLLVPTSPPAHRLVWNDAEAMQNARARADTAAATMRDCGANVTRTAVGANDPLSAIEDELRDHGPYEAIVICSLPAGVSRWLKADLVSRCRQHTGLPVIHTVAQQEWTPPPPGAPPRPIGGGQQTATAGAVPATLPPSIPVRDSTEALSALLESVGASPAIVRATTDFEHSLRGSATPEPELLALVMLRVAQLLHCAYTWQDGVGVARGLGISDDRMAALDHWQSSEHVAFSDRDRATLKYVDALVHGGEAAHSARETLSAYASPDAIVVITHMAGLARATADLASSFKLVPAEPFVGWGVHTGRAAAIP